MFRALRRPHLPLSAQLSQGKPAGRRNERCVALNGGQRVCGLFSSVVRRRHSGQRRRGGWLQGACHPVLDAEGK